MKVLHSSDNHIDFYATRLGSTKIVNGRNAIYVERLERTKSIIQKGIEEDVDVFVFSGDFHNKTRPPPQEYSDIFELLDMIPPKKPVFFISGNHDEPTSRGTALQPLVGRRNNIVVALQLTAVEYNGVHFILAPWGTPFEEVREWCSDYKSPKVLVYHVGVTKAGINFGEIEGEIGQVKIDDLVTLECDAVMLGHYHGQTKFVDSRNIFTKIAYAGSPECFNFGESEQQKGFLIWNLETKSVTQHSINYSKFITVFMDSFLADQFEKDYDYSKCYVRIKGDVSETEKVAVFDKLRNFKCMGVKLDLKNKVKKQHVVPLKGRNNVEILREYLTQKNVGSIESLLELDKEIEDNL